MMFWLAVCLAQKSLGYHGKTHTPYKQSCKSFNIKFNPLFKIEYKWSYKFVIWMLKELNPLNTCIKVDIKT